MGENKPKKKKVSAREMKRMAEALLEKAEKLGVDQNFLFISTFERYKYQIEIMADLEKEIKTSGALVSKEYVKGRGNLYTNPAIGEYNKTSTAANGTVATLIAIIKEFGEPGGEQENKLAAFLRHE